MGSADGGPVRCALLQRRAREKRELDQREAAFCPLRSKGSYDLKLRGCGPSYVAA
eukprot:CAMPEP_0198199062 /NCGR_PEP_ID=MMETSP1445-20131203/2394_1 /TAXON_ID=36898 /ORGANISM="Pyramimonas sp., Strain CCMP2087" /LENGTH=54 /DNA_ID=CAMNT_0043868775 /DNA_START=1 /DNA_END=162 /DNA_ORIENTATION=-